MGKLFLFLRVLAKIFAPCHVSIPRLTEILEFGLAGWLHVISVRVY